MYIHYSLGNNNFCIGDTMTKQYKQELRPTGKAPGEYQMFYIEETLSAEVEAEIAILKAENEAKALAEESKIPK